MRKRYASDELLSISEFAELVGATRSQLIYYDKQGLFRPLTRQDAGAQAANRRYTLDQAYTFRMISLFQQMGCSLPTASEFASNSLENCESFLQEQQQRLVKEANRLKTMQSSVDMLLRLDQLCREVHGAEPVAFTLAEPRHCAFCAFDPPCVRNTRRFASEYAASLQKMTADVFTMPSPVGLIYSRSSNGDGFFPVKGILTMYREGCCADKADFTLEPGRYLGFKVRSRLSQFLKSCMPVRTYLLKNHLVRTSPLIGWNVGVEEENGQIVYTELLTIRVVDGEPPQKGIPVMPGVD